MTKILHSFREFKRTCFPQATIRQEVEELKENPKLFGRYLAIKSFGKTHQQAMEELY